MGSKKRNFTSRIADRCSLRVASGELKGRKLAYPDSGRLRPTMQRAKISLFDSICELVRGSIFVDLFAGAGAVGIEAASRGAAFIHFVETDRRALKFLEVNLEACGLGRQRSAIHCRDAYEFIKSADSLRINPDIIYADPPYSDEKLPYLLEIIRKKKYDNLKLLIIEHDKTISIGNTPEAYEKEEKKFGQTAMTYFRNIGGDAND